MAEGRPAGLGKMLGDHPVCPIGGKLRHDSRASAKRHCKRLKRRHGYPGDVYQCMWCKGWHVGRPGTKRQPP